MHKSKLGGFIIDCKTHDLRSAATFWAGALGAEPKHKAPDPADPYVRLQMPDDELAVEVQSVDHASRVHLDIEADDIEAEVRRLERLGARRIADIKTWCVMEAPTGQRFCVVPVSSKDFDRKANEWD